MTIQRHVTARNTASSFATSQGTEEHFLYIEPDSGLSCADAISQVHARYRQALTQRALSADTQIFTRVYLSDIENHM